MGAYKNNTKVEHLRRPVLGEEICYSCNGFINHLRTLFPIDYYRITTRTYDGRIERSCLVHESCFKENVQRSLGKHELFITAKILDLSSFAR
ncbi:hypothetical protein HYX15_02255 [Candidatus Woesearchaeota archaeon]|nr:hypothetical protein [Candidatus Woesearchaeota archaeon]